MKIKKIIEGMTAVEVADLIDENFKGLDAEKANKKDTDEKFSNLGAKINERLPVVNEDGFFVTDKLNNIGLKYTKDGLDAALLSLHFIKLLKDAGIGSGNIGNVVVEDGFFFVDEALNIGVAIDNEGIHAKNILEYEVVDV